MDEEQSLLAIDDHKNKNEPEIFWNKSIDQVASELQVDIVSGLSIDEIDNRRAKYLRTFARIFVLLRNIWTK
jgi:hypothetical protein